LRKSLVSAGFELVRGAPDVIRARFAPRFVPRRTPGRSLSSLPSARPRRALIVGAGLAGAAAASALADLGWLCTVFDRHAAPAAETSGNPGGLFHGSLHPGDGAHARFNRAAALAATRCYRPLIESGAVPGCIDGLLRLETGLPDRAAMQALLDQQKLPPEYLQALSQFDASALCGLPLPAPAWLYAGGGWLSPAALVRYWLADARIDFRGGAEVDRLLATAGGGWQLLDRQGGLLAEAPVVVLANAADAPSLIGPHGDAAWPLSRSRGQVSWWAAAPAGLPQLRLPLAGSGYALTLPNSEGSARSGLLCGASVAEGDDDAAIRPADPAHNLLRLSQLTGLDLPAGLRAALPTPEGRVGWRLNAPDRLPLVGAVALRFESLPPGARLDQARMLPRRPGLFVLGALGSRGISWAPLAAQVLAAWIDGAPLPLESDLLDAIDPARFVVRARNRGARNTS
jgi:tRNA 5-methylaminomethyl-2-thiouridine biosynthesis bifunctional protein